MTAGRGRRRGRGGWKEATVQSLYPDAREALAKVEHLREVLRVYWDGTDDQGYLRSGEILPLRDALREAMPVLMRLQERVEGLRER